MLFHHLKHVLADQRWRLGHNNACLLQGLYLTHRIALALLHDGACVAHSSFWRSCQASNKSHNWLFLGVIFLQPISSHLLSLTSDFSDHDYAFGFGVDHELLKDIDKVGAVEWVTSNADNCGLA